MSTKGSRVVRSFSGSERAAIFHPSLLVWSSLNKLARMEEQAYMKMLRSIHEVHVVKMKLAAESMCTVLLVSTNQLY